MSATAPAVPATFADFKAPPAKQAIAKVRYTHDAMIDMIVANPWISQGELATNFGYTEGWVSQVIASDAFQARLAERKNDLIDPHLRATVEERFKGLVLRSIEILMRKLDEPTKSISDETALKALEIASRAAGYGAKSAQINLNQQFVAVVPAKAGSVAEWTALNGAGGSPVNPAPSLEAPQRTGSEVLVGSGSAAPNSKPGAALLDELKGA